MPNILLKIPKGAFSGAARTNLVRGINEAAAIAERIPADPAKRFLCWVVIEEVEPGKGLPQVFVGTGSQTAGVVTAGTLLADDGETPVGSIFVIDAADRAAVDAFTRSDPYHVNGVWERVEINRYNKKRGTAIASRR